MFGVFPWFPHLTLVPLNLFDTMGRRALSRSPSNDCSIGHTQQPFALFQGLFLTLPPQSSLAGVGPGEGHPRLSGEAWFP